MHKIHARDLTNPFVLTDGLKGHLEAEVSRRLASVASYLAQPPVSTPLLALIALLQQVCLFKCHNYKARILIAEHFVFVSSETFCRVSQKCMWLTYFFL